MLIRLPNGDWISPDIIVGVRVSVGDTMGPRVVLDTKQQYGHHMIEFDNPEAARQWAEAFGQKCAEPASPM